MSEPARAPQLPPTLLEELVRARTGVDALTRLEAEVEAQRLCVSVCLEIIADQRAELQRLRRTQEALRRWAAPDTPR
jgi:hypothetical protein